MARWKGTIAGGRPRAQHLVTKLFCLSAQLSEVARRCSYSVAAASVPTRRAAPPLPAASPHRRSRSACRSTPSCGPPSTWRQSGARPRSGSRRVRARLRHWIVVPQVALSLVLLVVAAIHVRALSSIELSDLGYQTDQALTLRVNRWEWTPPYGSGGNDAQRLQEEAAAKLRTFAATSLRE